MSFYFLTGTLRPDLIESASELASGKADAIKTHHNDTDLVRQLRRQVFYKNRFRPRLLSERLFECSSTISIHWRYCGHFFVTSYRHKMSMS